MERVLSSVDLVSMIFSKLERADQAHSALVCRGWFHPAMQNLWNSLDSIIYILRLLPCVKYQKKLSNGEVSESVLFYVRSLSYV